MKKRLHSKDDEAASIALDGEGGLSVLGKNGLSGGKTEYMLVRYAKKELTIPPGDGAASPALAFTEQRGQLTDTSGTSVDDIRFYSLGTNPSIFARKDRPSLAICWPWCLGVLRTSVCTGSVWRFPDAF